MPDRPRTKPLARLLTKVRGNPETGCWEWQGYLDRAGYGRFYAGPGRTAAAHRAAYEFLMGPIPNGLVIDHLCRNPRCVFPRHLEPVTNRENTMRGLGPAMLAAKRQATPLRTHCVRGHEYTEENTYLRPSRPSERQCLTCIRARSKREYDTRKAARLANQGR